MKLLDNLKSNQFRLSEIVMCLTGSWKFMHSLKTGILKLNWRLKTWFKMMNFDILLIRNNSSIFFAFYFFLFLWSLCVLLIGFSCSYILIFSNFICILRILCFRMCFTLCLCLLLICYKLFSFTLLFRLDFPFSGIKTTSLVNFVNPSLI